MRTGSWHRVAPLGAGDFPAGTPLHRFFAWNEAARHKDRRYVIARDVYTLFAGFGGGDAARDLSTSHLAHRPLISARLGGSLRARPPPGSLAEQGRAGAPARGP